VLHASNEYVVMYICVASRICHMVLGFVIKIICMIFLYSVNSLKK
jgi:hypothetical protein